MNDALELAGKTLPAGAPDEIRGQEAQVLENCPKEFFGRLRGSDFAGMGKGVAGWGSRAADAGERAGLEAQGIATIVETDAVVELGVGQADDMTPRAEGAGFVIRFCLASNPGHQELRNEVANLTEQIQF